MDNLKHAAASCGQSLKNVRAISELIEEGCTIPFIARYRKEKTGGLDEVAIAAIRDALENGKALLKRKETILRSLENRGLLSDALKQGIERADTSTALEDLYLKYRPKKNTRASAARDKGLEPLALNILQQPSQHPDALASRFVNPDQGVSTRDEALEGARDILAEIISDDTGTREALRHLFIKKAVLTAKAAKGVDLSQSRFRDLAELTEAAAAVPSHRFLAVMRAASEKQLKVSVLPPDDDALAILEKRHVKTASPCSAEVRKAASDAWRRLLKKSLETEHINRLKEKADITAIAVFSNNLKELLLASPLGQKPVIAIDPGFRTGCKTVCLDRQGTLIHWTTLFPHTGKADEAGKTLTDLVKKYRCEAIAVGNGTAGRETERFVRGLSLPETVQIVMVDESGASVYSASPIARDEFPDHDITVRGAVSIGRRLMDPLAELVKIDPKAIGVGQYQHDVDPKLLQQALDDTVILCVNRVGVELNTASPHLLARISGLTPSLAAAIVDHRLTNGPFRNRRELMTVARFGPRAFEQSAGFLRIIDSSEPLDATGIHPESYAVVDQMAADARLTTAELMKMPDRIAGLNLSDYVTEGIGLPTLTDIAAELRRPGRDPRTSFTPFRFDDTIQEITDLEPGMRIPGIVTNVTAFGAFVDIGIHQDGLVHISQLSNRFIKDPAEVVKVRQKVMVRVLEVDIPRRRISLSMKQEQDGFGNP